MIVIKPRMRNPALRAPPRERLGPRTRLRSSLKFREQDVVLNVNVLGQILGQFGKSGVEGAPGIAGLRSP